MRPHLLALGALAGCSLTGPPGEYFDETGAQLTLAVLENEPSAVLLTERGFVAVSGQAMVHIERAGAPPTEIARMANEPPKEVAARGSIVAWCSDDELAFMWDGATIRKLADVTRCMSVAVDATAISVLDDPNPVDDAPLANVAGRVVRFDAAGVKRAEILLPVFAPRPERTGRIASADDGTLFVAASRGLLRLCERDNCSSSCAISTRSLGQVTRVKSERIGESYLTVIINPTRTAYFRSEGGLGPCIDVVLPCRTAAECAVNLDKGPQPQTFFTTIANNVALSEQGFWRMNEGTLERAAAPDWSFAPVRTGLGAALRNLAVDDAFAYFSNGRRLQQLRLSD